MDTEIDKNTLQQQFPDIWNQAVGLWGGEEAALEFLTSENANLDGETPLDIMNGGDGDRVSKIMNSGENGLII